MTLTLANLVAYGIQLAVLVSVASIAVTLLRLRAPVPSLRFWQGALIAGLTLPFLSRTIEPSAALLESSATLVTNSTPVVALASRGVDSSWWILFVLSAGGAIRVMWLLLGFVRLRGILARTASVPELDSMAAELGTAIGARATLRLTDEIGTPATVGLRRAIVLLPHRTMTMPPAVQRAVIAHELVHVKRRDWFHTLLEECWCALLWFHPAARVLATRLSLARETVVDAATIRLTRDRRAYAEALLAFSNPQLHVRGVTPLIGRQSLSQRILLIAEEEVMSRRRMLVSFALAVVFAVTATASAVSTLPITRGSAPQTVVHKPGNGVTLPTVVHEVKPDYTPQALQQKIQGSVWMSVVVLASGNVGDAEITKSLDAEYGLDQQALTAAREWKFTPGTKDGKAVAVEVTVEMRFTLK